MESNDDARLIFDKVTIPIAYKMGYITNNYREPSFRAIESEYGLARPETLVLIFLAAMDGCTASEICEHSGHLKNNISRAVTALEAKGLVRRSPSADDMRRQHLYITAKGRQLHGKFMPKLLSRERAMMACLTKGEYALFEELLRKICANVPNWCGESL
ncbi:DNA-binding transcriptional regulator, MarR family [Variovorax sp. HW608]|uniref:MarR family winged helix-turn-helix transcriptional regulator n=1 Tax=Variovorax sp. HW608 TaxID=1034889 RepID=UPI00081FAF13|nr:MarR family winged helix-turn-helix transcriptional regulator [Variovorax sp. HW608]SCK35260.1 DNA-binding transcriptional regulator, MarR family [Variovorax sp. HW608]